MATLPKEVADYFAAGRRKAVSVEPQDDYTLVVTFDNGEARLFAMPPRMGVMAALNALSKFKKCFVDEFGNIAWDVNENIDSSKVWSNRIDLCADSVYIYSKPL